MKIPELLVPVGGPEQLRAAIANGADAVYMSGSAFNARLNADNFGDDEIAQAIDLAHEYGVRVHITQNTLIKTEEMEAALENAVRMYEYGADALIIQDRGLASALKRIIPDMPLHMSTQGTVYDINGAREAVNAGFDRIILSRELSRNEIAAACRAAQRELHTEIEIFVHGAICICYSGQCHMSEFIGGRSGNRGACAQPCRLPYRLIRDGRDAGSAAYPLSPADMSLIHHLRDISEMGVASLKIEGRMKSPEYVATVTSVYRKYLDFIAHGDDARVEADDMNALRQIFSRGCFTDAYFKGESGKQLMSDDLPKHHGVKLGELVSADRKRGHAVVKLSTELSNGDGVEIRADAGYGAGLKQNASAGGVITYIKQVENSKNKKEKNNRTPEKSKKAVLLKTAQRGQTVEIGDIPALSKADASVLRPGAAVYKISDAALNAAARASYEKLPQRVKADISFEGREGERAVLTVSEHGSDPGSAGVTVRSAEPLEKAIKRPADKESVMQRLKKTGGTPYDIVSCQVDLKGEPAVSAAEINAMRRAALAELTEKRISRAHRAYDRDQTALWSLSAAQNAAEHEHVGDELTKNGKISVTLNVYPTDASEEHASERALELIEAAAKVSAQTTDRASEAGAAAYRLNIPYRSAIDDRVIDAAAEAGVYITACMPTITKKSYSGEPMMSADDIDRMKALCAEGKLYGVSIANPSQLIFFRSEQNETSAAGGASKTPRIFFEESMNIYNAYTAERARARGMVSGVVSHELKPSDMEGFRNIADACEFSVWGRIPLMYTEHCPAGSTPAAGGGAGAGLTALKHCCSEHSKKHYCRMGRYELEDRKGERFPLVLDDRTCRCTVMSYKPADYTRDLPQLKKAGIKRFRVNIFDEDINEIMDILKYVR